METIYFAYGSNMLFEELKSFSPTAKVMGIACLEGKVVVFNKRSEKDGSGKANLIIRNGGSTWGVLYEIAEADLNKLDKKEGGYKRQLVKVKTEDMDIIEAVTYISANLIDEPVAYDSYKEKVIRGAQEHNLPETHISYLIQLPSRPDTSKNES
jgi:cation transport regulator ChaC